MSSFEALCGRLFGQAGWMPKMLWGGALTFIPVVNFLPLGYIMEYTLRLSRTGDGELPDLKDFSLLELFSSGCKLALLLLGYLILPVFFGWGVSEFLDLLTFGFLGVAAYLPVGVGAFAGMFLFLSGVRSYARDGLYADAWRIKEVATLAGSAYRALIFPILAFWGLCLLAFPLYGFAFFIGVLSLLAYSSALFREIEKDS
ncbi:MAG: DUF4013 domain-containing protein [Opitutales bacterium]|nr:DUF4013 domain-containing protein [Opitutales bacterium]